MEAAHRTSLAKGEVGLVQRKPAPRLEDFAPRFLAAMQHQCKPATLEFYTAKMTGILKYRDVATARLDGIDEALIAEFVRWRRGQVGVTAVNRALATLRRALRLAQQWRPRNTALRFSNRGVALPEAIKANIEALNEATSESEWEG